MTNNITNYEFLLNALTDLVIEERLEGREFTGESILYGIEKILDEETEKIIELKYKENKRPCEICEELGIPEHQLRHKLERATRSMYRDIRCFQSYSYETIEMLENQVKELTKKNSELKEMINKIFYIACKETETEFYSSLVSKTPIENLGLSIRSFRALVRKDCKTVGDIVELFRTGKIKSIKNLGSKSILEVERALISAGVEKQYLEMKEDC